MALFKHTCDLELPLEAELLYAGRRRVTRRFVLGKDGNVDDVIFAAYGAEDPGAITSCLMGYANLKLVAQKVQPVQDPLKPSILVQIFETLTATLAPEGDNRSVKGEDGRVTAQVSFIGLPAATGGYAIGAVVTVDGVSLVITRAEKQLNDAFLRIVYTGIQATSTPAQIGDVQIATLPRAYIGTSSGLVTSTTKPARIFTYQYLVAGDGTDSAWLPITQQFASENLYLVDESAVLKGFSYTILQRRYAEKPDNLKFTTEELYSFPGQVSLRLDAVPYITKKPITRLTVHNIDEKYFLNEAAAIAGKVALGYEPLVWSYGVFAYKPTDNNPSGLLGYDNFEFSNCLGQYTIAGGNGYYNGIKVDSIVGNLYSDPATYPTGLKVVWCVHAPWLGDMWKVTTISITFP